MGEGSTFEGLLCLFCCSFPEFPESHNGSDGERAIVYIGQAGGRENTYLGDFDISTQVKKTKNLNPGLSGFSVPSLVRNS